MGTGFQVIPVLDVMGGRAVHAMGGDRARYQPLRSILHPGHEPRELARAIRDQLGLRTLYLADLDAIECRVSDSSLYHDLTALGLELWLDGGFRDARDLNIVSSIPGVHIVAGLETLCGPDGLSGILNQFGPDRVIVSLDLRDGQPLSRNPESWPNFEPIAIARTIVACGARRILLLDLARVGNGRGTGTAPLLKTLRTEFPQVEFATGGGIAGMADVRFAEECGASAVLVGSAIHDGRLDSRSVNVHLTPSPQAAFPGSRGIENTIGDSTAKDGAGDVPKRF